MSTTQSPRHHTHPGAEMADWLGRCAPLDCGPFLLLATAGYQAMDNRQAIKALLRP
jgi:hypothetical protein